jgi:6-phosphogluconolactonase
MHWRQSLAMTLCFGLAVIDAHSAGTTDELVYIGTFTFGPPAQGAASEQRPIAQQGIYGARLDTKTGHLSALGLSAQINRASWLVTHPTLPILYTVAQSPSDNPASDSAVISFAIDPESGTLRQIAKTDAGGRDATHMAFDTASKTLFVANHGTGTVTALPVLTDGTLGAVASEQKDFGTGPTPRQKSASAHGVAVDPTHHYVMVADFGADRLFVYRFDGATRALTPAPTAYQQLPPGSGPRHVLFHPNGKLLYLDNELTGEICSYQWDGRRGELRLAQCQSPYPADYSGQKSAAEIAISRDGRYFYLSLRGDQEALIVYSIDRVSGALTEIQRISPQGKIPWSLGIDPTGHWMLVADQGSNSVAVFAVALKTGKLTATGESLSVPNPVAVAFYRH